MLKSMRSDCYYVFDMHGNLVNIEMTGFEPQDHIEYIHTIFGLTKCQLFINANDETDQVWVKI